MPELSLVLSFSLLSFMANSTILTFYFSNVLSSPNSKHVARRDGFLLSLSGSTAGAVFSIVIPYLPETLPFLDFTVGLVLITWAVLLHYHFKEGWLEAVVQAVIAGIIYIVVLAVVTGFLILWIGT